MKERTKKIRRNEETCEERTKDNICIYFDIYLFYFLNMDILIRVLYIYL